jgi:carboxylesterase type B
VTTDALFTCQSVRVAHALTPSGVRVYRYPFDHATTNWLVRLMIPMNMNR